MPIDLRGRVIAITGASSGIGAETAVACAAAGMHVAIGARRADRLDKVVERIQAAARHAHSHGKAIAVSMDVTRPEDSRRLLDRAAAELGPVYAVFANAGYSLEQPVADMTDAQMRDIFECNFYGTMNIVRPAVEAFRAAPPPADRGPRGHILICSSCLAKLPVPLNGAYSATKAAQNHVGRAMRLELAAERIAVSTVHPVGTKTEFFEEMARRSGVPKSVQHVPEALMQKPDRVARAIVRCLQRPKAEVWTSLPTRLGMAVCIAFPGIDDFYLRRMVAKAANGKPGTPPR